MKRFHYDTQYMTRPAVNSESIQKHIFSFSREVYSVFSPQFPHGGQNKIVSYVQVMLSHLALDFYRINISRLAQITGTHYSHGFKKQNYFPALVKSSQSLSQLLVVDQEC